MDWQCLLREPSFLSREGRPANVSLQFGYMVWCFPAGGLLQKLPIAKTMSVAMMLWGVLLIGSGFVNSFSQLMACRFLLGLLEAPIVPGNMLVLSMCKSE